MSDSRLSFDDRYRIGSEDILPPVAPGNLPTVVHPHSPTLICYDQTPKKRLWKSAIITGALITACAAVLGSWGAPFLTAWINAEKPHEPSPENANRCAGVETHFNAAINLRDVGLKRQLLNDFIFRFKGCDFYEDAVFALADLSKANQLAQGAVMQVGPTSEMQAALPNDGLSVATIPAALPPIDVRPSNLDLSMNLGKVAVLNSGITYRLRLQPFFTTTISVREGNISLKIDGKENFECFGGNEFRLFTQGWSKFEIQGRAYYSQIQVTKIQNGDFTAVTDCQPPSQS